MTTTALQGFCLEKRFCECWV